MKTVEKAGDDGAVPAVRSQDNDELERSAVTQAYFQNEEGRDAFLALAHTALFAASIAFVGDLTGPASPRLLWLLMMAWLASVIGLLALTAGFHVASRHMTKRLRNIDAEGIGELRLVALLNSLALWSFPVALGSTFVFAAVNMLTQP